MEDLIGTQFGKLKVIALGERDSRHHRKWVCLCACGIKKEILGYNLKARGDKATCGCGQVQASRRNPIPSGEIFGKLVVLEFAGTIKGRSRYSCLCACGKIKIIKAEKLKSGWTLSCGCLVKNNGGDFKKTHGFSKTGAYRRVCANKSRLKSLGFPRSFGFTVEDVLFILNKQQYSCFYCEVLLSDNYHLDHTVPLCAGGSFDKDNLCAACPTCNLKKGKRAAEDFLDTLVSGKVMDVNERQRDAKSTQV